MYHCKISACLLQHDAVLCIKAIHHISHSYSLCLTLQLPCSLLQQTVATKNTVYSISLHIAEDCDQTMTKILRCGGKSIQLNYNQRNSIRGARHEFCYPGEVKEELSGTPYPLPFVFPTMHSNSTTFSPNPTVMDATDGPAIEYRPYLP